MTDKEFVRRQTNRAIKSVAHEVGLTVLEPAIDNSYIVVCGPGIPTLAEKVQAILDHFGLAAVRREGVELRSKEPKP